MTSTTRTHVGHALRVAGIATALIAVVLAIAAGAFDLAVNHRLTGQADIRLAAALDSSREVLAKTPPNRVEAPPNQEDADDTPLFVWTVTPSGAELRSAPNAPRLPPASWDRSGAPTTIRIGPSVFRVMAVRFRGGWLVAGISLAEQRHIQSNVLDLELIAGPIAVAGMFLGSLVIGVEASAPVEHARRRQLEFTADASHELRTPLTVIEAEVQLALDRPRDPGSYRQSLEHIRDESGRLRRIIDNLLWLGRMDATAPPASEPIDLAVIAESCVQRFAPRAEAKQLTLGVQRTGTGEPWVAAPAEWIDRLAGVLVDNACRYTPDGGTVQVSIETRPGRVVLAVDDSGPGIDPSERPRLFDRFHRVSDEPGGTGLGLAIGDAVVRATGGQWNLGDSELGGARMAVTWHRAHG